MSTFSATNEKTANLLDKKSKDYSFNYFSPIAKNVNSTDLKKIYTPAEDSGISSLPMTQYGNNLHTNETCNLNAVNIQSNNINNTKIPDLNKGLYLKLYSGTFDQSRANLNNSGTVSSPQLITSLPSAQQAIVEITGYFIPNTNGRWSFESNANLIWIGDNAVYDYATKNADITNPSNATKSIIGLFVKNKQYPFRLQCQPGISIMLNVKGPEQNAIPQTITNIFKTTSDGQFYNSLTYYALVENSPNGSKQGLFKCYTMTVNPNDPTAKELANHNNEYIYKLLWKMPGSDGSSLTYANNTLSFNGKNFHNNTNGLILLQDDGDLLCQSADGTGNYNKIFTNKKNINASSNNNWANEKQQNNIKMTTPINYFGTVLVSNNNKYKLKIDSQGNLVLIASVIDIAKSSNPNIPYKYSNNSVNKDGIVYYPYRAQSTPFSNNMYLEHNADPANITLNKVSNDLLMPTNNYSKVYNGYFPESSATKIKTSNCKQLCNDDTTCTSYFEMINQDNSKSCVINKNKPSITPRNPGMPKSSKLYIKDMNLKLSATDLRNNIPINTTDNYSAFNSYEIITPNTVTDKQDSGILQSDLDSVAKWKTLITGTNGFTGKINVESFDNHGFNGNTFSGSITNASSNGIVNDMQTQQIQPLRQIAVDYNNLQQRIANNESTLGNTIGQYNDLRDNTLTNPKYDFQTGQPLNYLNQMPTITDALNEDANTMILSQNNVYMLGTVTIATLLIAAIYIGRE